MTDKTAAGETVDITTPPGHIKDDPTFGTTEIYHDHVQGDIAATDLPAGQVIVIHPGGADRGTCYPPLRKRIDLGAMTVPNGAPAVPSQDYGEAVPAPCPLGAP